MRITAMSPTIRLHTGASSKAFNNDYNHQHHCHSDRTRKQRSNDWSHRTCQQIQATYIWLNYYYCCYYYYYYYCCCCCY